MKSEAVIVIMTISPLEFYVALILMSVFGGVVGYKLGWLRGAMQKRDMIISKLKTR